MQKKVSIPLDIEGVVDNGPTPIEECHGHEPLHNGEGENEAVRVLAPEKDRCTLKKKPINY